MKSLFRITSWGAFPALAVFMAFSSARANAHHQKQIVTSKEQFVPKDVQKLTWKNTTQKRETIVPYVFTESRKNFPGANLSRQQHSKEASKVAVTFPEVERAILESSLETNVKEMIISEFRSGHRVVGDNKIQTSLRLLPGADATIEYLGNRKIAVGWIDAESGKSLGRVELDVKKSRGAGNKNVTPWDESAIDRIKSVATAVARRRGSIMPRVFPTQKLSEVMSDLRMTPYARNKEGKLVDLPLSLRETIYQQYEDGHYFQVSDNEKAALNVESLEENHPAYVLRPGPRGTILLEVPNGVEGSVVEYSINPFAHNPVAKDRNTQRLRNELAEAVINWPGLTDDLRKKLPEYLKDPTISRIEEHDGSDVRVVIVPKDNVTFPMSYRFFLRDGEAGEIELGLMRITQWDQPGQRPHTISEQTSTDFQRPRDSGKLVGLGVSSPTVLRKAPSYIVELMAPLREEIPKPKAAPPRKTAKVVKSAELHTPVP